MPGTDYTPFDGMTITVAAGADSGVLNVGVLPDTLLERDETEGRLEAYDELMFKAIWVEQKDMNDPAVIGEVLSAGGFEPATLMQAVQDPMIKSQLIEATEEGVSRGLFGVPSMIVDGELHFGQDRLDWIARALTR